MKKVISFVLVLALVLGSFSMAFAATGLSDIEDSANADAINVVNDLGVVTGYTDGTFKPGQAVNRAEFAAMITRALAVPDSALAGFTATNFKDTSGYGWAVKYLAFCDSKGIMLGDGNGNAMPGRTITVNEAITMVCRAIGYVEGAEELVGTWPANYVSLAQTLGLYDDMTATGLIDRANAAQLVYNALTVPKVYIDVEGRTQYVTGNPDMMTDLGGYIMNRGNSFVLTSTQANTAVINVNEYVGAAVKAYANEDGDIIAVEVVSTFLDGKYNAADGLFETDAVDYYLEASVVGDATPTPGAVVENGVTSTGGFALNDGDETILAVDVSGKTIKKIYSRIDWTADEVFMYEEEMLDTEDCTLNDHKFATDNNGEIDTNTFALVGVDSLDKIAVDNVVTVYKSGTITKVTVGTETVEGKITKISGSDYYIDGKAYALSGDDVPVLGDPGTAYLDANGDIAFWSADSASAGNYAIYVAKDTKTSYGDSTTNVKLFTKDGEEITPELKSGVTVSGISEGTIVEYSLDKNGKVNKILDATTTASITGSINKNATRIGTTPLKDGVVAFVYDADAEEWTIANIKNFDTDFDVDGSGIEIVLDDGKVAALSLPNTDVYGSEPSFGIITTISTAVDESDDEYWSVEGFIGGEALDAFTDVDASAATPVAISTTSTGIYKISVDADGIVTGVTVASIGTGTNDDIYDKLSARTITKVDTTKNEVTASTGVYGVTEDVVIYVYDAADDEWTVETSLSKLKNKTVEFYQTDKDLDGYDIAIAW